MPLPDPIVDAFRQQADACRDLGSPFNAMVCDLLSDRLEPGSAFGQRIANWPGQPVADALALRACGSLHGLIRSGRCPALMAAYPPTPGTPDAVWTAIRTAIAEQDGFLTRYLDSPPQTNEVARSSMILGGCLTIAETFRLPLEIYEIGSSAGLNLGFDHYHYDLGGRSWGSPTSKVRIVTKWEGPVPLDVPLTVVRREGCDRNPLDPGSSADRDRLLSYIWPDQSNRLARIDAALQVAASANQNVDRADAADWVEQRLARPCTPGRARVLMHTIVWQYLPADTQRRIEAAVYQAGEVASGDAPLAWLRVEPDGVPGSAGIRLSLWPSGKSLLLGRADYHGRWSRWNAMAQQSETSAQTR
ncbi:hypothetical protein BAL199_27756 [alpha proteobacterium BAL199]|nr:hypothetical protein BAL199_27756 [alpha proteobacterium BAL199]